MELTDYDQAVIDAADHYATCRLDAGVIDAAWDALSTAVTARRAALVPPPPIERTEVECLRTALIATRDELARWGWGDFHYGSQPQDQRVVDAIALADAALVVSVEPQ